MRLIFFGQLDQVGVSEEAQEHLWVVTAPCPLSGGRGGRAEKKEDDSEESSAELTEKELSHVNVKLKSSGSSVTSERNAQLARLFEACGLETRFKGTPACLIPKH